LQATQARVSPGQRRARQGRADLRIPHPAIRATGPALGSPTDRTHRSCCIDTPRSPDPSVLTCV